MLDLTKVKTQDLGSTVVEAPSVFKYSFNSSGKNKDWDFEKLATEYQDTTGTIYDVMDHVKNGHALGAGLFGGSRRNKVNVVGSQWLLLDIDNSEIMKDSEGNPIDQEGRLISKGKQHFDIEGNPIDKADGRKGGKKYKHELTLDETLVHPFVQSYCALIYTTASHTKDWHRFRLVFLLPYFVEGSGPVEVMVKRLMSDFPHDPSCKDASRVFYGSTKASFPLINPNVYLPIEWLDKAILEASEEVKRIEVRKVEATAKRERVKSSLISSGVDEDTLILEALICIPPRQVGGQTYDNCLNVLKALHSHYGPVRAKSIAESWSPSQPDTSWDIPYKLSTFKGSGITIATLFHIAQKHGFKYPVGTDEIQAKIDALGNGSGQAASNSIKNYGGKGQDEVENFSDETFELTKLAINKRKEINQKQDVLKPVLEGTELGRIVSRLSEGSTIPYEALLSMIIPLYAPLVAAKGRVFVSKKTAWYEPLVFYMVLCAESSQSKTPITSPLVKPLLDFEEELAAKFKEDKKQADYALEEYNADKKNKKGNGEYPPDAAVRRKYLFDSFTFESFQSQAVNQPLQGLTVFVDELKGFFGSLNMYRKGDDMERLLSWWSGGPINRSTMGNGAQFCRRTGNSFVGTIQPGVLKDLRLTLDSDDSSGFWYRWLTYTLPSTWKYDLDESENDTFDLGLECDTYFSRLIRIWDSWGEFEIKCDVGTGKWIDDRINISEISSEYKGKLKAYALRFAGFIACVEASKDGGTTPPTKMNKEYLRIGLDMAKYYYLQKEVAFDSEGSGDEALERIHRFVLKKDKATVATLKNRDRTLKPISDDKLSDLCSKTAIAYPGLRWDGKTLTRLVN